MSTKSVSGNAAPATPAAQAGPATAGQAQAFSAQAAPAASPPPAPAPLSPAQQIGQAGMVGAQGQLQAGGQFLEQMGKVNWGTPGSVLNGVRMGGQKVREVIDINVQYMQGRELAFIQRETPIAGDGSVAEAVPHMIGSVMAGALGTLLAAGSIEATRQMRAGETDPGKILATGAGTAALSYGLDKAGDWLMGFITRGPGQGGARPIPVEADTPARNPASSPDGKTEPMRMEGGGDMPDFPDWEASERGMSENDALNRLRMTNAIGQQYTDLQRIPTVWLDRELLASRTAADGKRIDVPEELLVRERATRINEQTILEMPENDQIILTNMLELGDSPRPTPEIMNAIIDFSMHLLEYRSDGMQVMDVDLYFELRKRVSEEFAAYDERFRGL